MIVFHWLCVVVNVLSSQWSLLPRGGADSTAVFTGDVARELHCIYLELATKSVLASDHGESIDTPVIGREVRFHVASQVRPSPIHSLEHPACPDSARPDCSSSRFHLQWFASLVLLLLPLHHSTATTQHHQWPSSRGSTVARGIEQKTRARTASRIFLEVMTLRSLPADPPHSAGYGSSSTGREPDPK